MALVPYRNQGAFRYVSATDVMRGTLGADELKDRIVIVGASAGDSSTPAPRPRGGPGVETTPASSRRAGQA
jgi:CHASE2 domain-containing sensor protein